MAKTASHTHFPIAHCESMAQVRAHIDAIDAQLVPLLAQRAGYVAQAARIKQSPEQIVDEQRIEFIVRHVRALAQDYGLPPEIAERTWRAMMAAYIDFEREEFHRLRQQGAQPSQC